MKNIFISTLFIMISAVFFSCGSRELLKSSLPEEMPDDFAIVWEDWIEESNKNVFDTYKGYIQKDLITAGTARAEFTPSEEVKSEIYSMVRECALDKISRNLTSSELVGDRGEVVDVIPCTYYNVTFTALGNTYTISGDYTMSEYISEEEDAANFWNFIQFMSNLYRSVDEYKSLPEAEGGYA